MTPLSILVVGLLLGMQHATDADHLAAVATLATRNASLAQTLRQGVAWGFGHTISLTLFAGAVLALGQVVSPGLETALEGTVGAMLFLLGADVLRRVWLGRLPVHGHHPGIGSVAHAGADCRDDGVAAAAYGAHRVADAWPLRALAVGVMHGLAGSAALVVLSLKTVPTVALGLGYIAVFGIGSIAGMALLSVAIALPLRFSAVRLRSVRHLLSAGVGGISCALGAGIVLRAVG